MTSRIPSTTSHARIGERQSCVVLMRWERRKTSFFKRSSEKGRLEEQSLKRACGTVMTHEGVGLSGRAGKLLGVGVSPLCRHLSGQPLYLPCVMQSAQQYHHFVSVPASH